MVGITAITSTSATTVVNTNVRLQLQSVGLPKVENIYYLIKKTNMVVSR